MEHVPSIHRSIPWRAATAVLAVVATAELIGLLALAGVQLLPSLHGTPSPAGTAPAVRPAHTARRPKARVPSAWRRAAVASRAHALRPPSRLSVLVLNGNGRSGAAGAAAQRLLGAGYGHAIPADAASQDYARSLVLFAPGYEREAQRLGRQLGVRTVDALDGMKPSQLKGSQLVVILGDS